MSAYVEIEPASSPRWVPRAKAVAELVRCPLPTRLVLRYGARTLRMQQSQVRCALVIAEDLGLVVFTDGEWARAGQQLSLWPQPPTRGVGRLRGSPVIRHRAGDRSSCAPWELATVKRSSSGPN